MDGEEPIGQRLLDGILMAVVSGVGIISTVLVCVSLRNVPKYRRSSFGMMKTAQLIGDFVLLGIFFFYCSATILWIFQTPVYLVDTSLGYLSMVLWYSRLHIEIVISFDRLCAVSYPTHYKCHFSLRQTKIYIILCTFIACIVAAVHWFPGCEFSFSPLYENWMFARSECFTVDVYINLPHAILCVLSIIIVDLKTLVSLNKMRHKRTADSKFYFELEFFVQAFISAVSLSIVTVCFQCITPKLFEEGYTQGAFYTDAFAWNLVHASDGFLLIALNKDLRGQLCKLSRFSQNKTASLVRRETKCISLVNIS